MMIFFVCELSYGSTISKINILDASQNIKLLSQKISKEYIYFYNIQDKKHLLKSIEENILMLGEDIRLISTRTKDEKVKRLLAFFDYEKEQFLKILEKDPEANFVSATLDFSDSINEGAIFLSNYASYEYSFEEKMLLISQQVEFLSEKTIKYYMAVVSDVKKLSIENKIEVSLGELEKKIKIIQSYKYPKKYKSVVKDLTKYLALYKKLYQSLKIMRVPTIALIGTEGFSNSIRKLTSFHKQNQ